MTTLIRHITDYAAVAVNAARTSVRMFTNFLACMGFLLWLAGDAITWAQVWPSGVALWLVGTLASLALSGGK